MFNKKKKDVDGEPYRTDESLLECDIVKKVSEKMANMARYNSHVKDCLTSPRIMAKIDVQIVDGCVKTRLRNITFESTSVSDGIQTKHTLVVSSTCMMYFDQVGYVPLFTYSNWAELLNM